MSETKRSFIRIVSNYVRLAATFVMGIILVPLLLEFGEEAYGLTVLLTSTVGVGSWVEVVIQRTMVYELGSAYHENNAVAFRRVYCTALAVSVGAGVIVFGVVGAAAYFLPHLFDVPAGLEAAGQLFMLIYGVRVFGMIALAPVFNMNLVLERMPLFNFWIAAVRLSFPLGAGLVLLIGFSDPAKAVVSYAFWSSGLALLVIAASAAHLMMTYPELRLTPFLPDRRTVGVLMKTGGWNGGASVALGSQLLVGNVFINQAVGVLGNTFYGIAVQLSGYVRMVAGGMTGGIDAAAARISTSSSKEALFQFVSRTTALHAWSTYPAALLVTILAEPIITIWLAPRMENAHEVIPQTVALTRLMVIGLCAVAISDGWTKVMYGAGAVHWYAPIFLAAAVLNPILTGLLLWLMPEGARFQAVAWVYSGVNAVALLGVLPVTMGRWLGKPLVLVVRPLWKPLVLSVASLWPLLVFPREVEDWNLGLLLAAFSSYGAVYLVASFALLLSQDQRTILYAYLQRALRRSTA